MEKERSAKAKVKEMIDYTIVIGKEFLGERHIENNKNVVGSNAEEADSQYWVNSDTDVLKVEELYFDRLDGEFTITLINQKDDSLFLSVSVPIQDLAFSLAKVDFSPILTKMKSDIIKARTVMKELAAKAKKLDSYKKKSEEIAEKID